MKLKLLITVLMALFINAFFGATIASVADIPPIYGAVGLNVIGVGASFLKMPAGLRAEIFAEVWTSQVVEQYTHALANTFLDGIPDFSQYVDGNDIIHLTDSTVDPTVIVDNTTYPLETESFNDVDKSMPLTKLETKPTAVSDDELHAIAYDKMKIVKDRHGNKIAEGILDKTLHGYAPESNTNDTPVITTSGAVEDNRGKMVREDLIALRRKLDNLLIPKKGRRLVLCNDHVNDLLEADQKFKDQYHNYESGVITKAYGFEIYEHVNNPIFGQDLVKKSFGAVPAEGDFQASVFFYVPRMFKAKGSTKVYASDAKEDPVYKRNLMSFTTRFIGLPQKREKAVAAIVSKYVA